jgi:RNA polymerase sigma-70 factor, ECF subfamily
VIDAATFQALRPHLFAVAYRMLGSAAEAEDVMQDAWLRAASAPGDLTSARAWLTTVVTRLCLDRLKSARMQREEYVGPWLPEPVPTEAVETAEDQMTRRESVTMAFLVLLETLTPAERAAFLLREVFEIDYEEVARALEMTPAAVRQLVHRAKARVAEGRPRFPAPPERQREIVSRFFEAVRQGDPSVLQRHLAADVVFAADSGGRAAAARRQVTGIRAVSRLMAGIWRYSADPAWRTEVADINGETALVVIYAGRLETVFIFSTDADRITAIRAVRNPEKLAWLAAHTGLGAGEGAAS